MHLGIAINIKCCDQASPQIKPYVFCSSLWDKVNTGILIFLTV